MTPELTAAAAKWPAFELDNAWSTCPKTLRRARLLDLSGWAFYVAGRGGVLGDDARPDTVAAAIGVIAPDAVRSGWDAARKVFAWALGVTLRDVALEAHREGAFDKLTTRAPCPNQFLPSLSCRSTDAMMLTTSESGRGS